MKNLLLLFLLFAGNQFTSLAKTKDLPAEIKEYYKTKNFLCLYSQKQEREMINCLYLRGEDLSTIADPRIKRMVSVLFSTLIKYYYPVNFRNDSKEMIPPELLLSTINRIKDWKIEDNHIIVTTYTYSMTDDIIHKAINSYSSDISPDNMKIPDYSDNNYSRYQEIHDWEFVDGRWVKFPVLKVLVN